MEKKTKNMREIFQHFQSIIWKQRKSLDLFCWYKNTIDKTQQYLDNKPAGLQHYYKETTTRVFFCEIYQIFKNTFSYGKPPVTASDIW